MEQLCAKKECDDAPIPSPRGVPAPQAGCVPELMYEKSNVVVKIRPKNNVYL